MSNFLNSADPTALLPATKLDVPAPGGQDASYITGGDLNDLRSRVLDLHDDLRGGAVPMLPTGATTRRNLADRLAAVVDVRDFGAVGDGVTEDTAAINVAIAKLSSGGRLHFPAGTYLTHWINVQNLSNIEVTMAPDAMLKAHPTEPTNQAEWGRVITFTNCNGVRLLGLHIHGNRANITDVDTGANSGLVGVQNGLSFDTCSNVSVEDMLIEETVQDAFSAKTLTGSVVRGGHIRNSGSHGIYCSTSSADLVIADVHLENIGLSIPAGYIQLGDWMRFRDTVTRVVVRNCRVNAPYSGVSITDGSSDILVEGCTVSNAQVAWRVGLDNGTAHNKGVVFRNNTFRAAATLRSGVLSFDVQACDDMMVSGNIFDGFSSSFVASNVRVEGNTFANFTSNPVLSMGGGCKVVGNLISNCANRAIFVDGADNVLVGNTLKTVGEVGVRVNTTATDTIISANRITNCANLPIWNTGTRTSMSGNNVQGNSLAVSEAGTSTESDVIGALSVSGPVTIGGGTPIKKVLSATAAWDPPSTATGALSTATTVTVSGAALGDLVKAGFSVALPDGCSLVASVSAANTVKVQLLNLSGATQDLASGTLRVAVEQF